MDGLSNMNEDEEGEEYGEEGDERSQS